LKDKKVPGPGIEVTGHRREMREWRGKTDSSHSAVSKDYNFDLFKSGICYAVFAEKRISSHTTPIESCLYLKRGNVEVDYPFENEIGLVTKIQSVPRNKQSSSRF